MTGVDVEHTKALEAAATPGPWWAIVVNRSDDEAEIFAGSGLSSDLLVARDALSADAEFIAHARTAVPALVAAVERVQALHTPDEFGMCEGCGDNEHGYAIVPHPCPTIRELEIK